MDSLAFYLFYGTGIFVSLQSETEQRPHKVSFYVQKDKAEEVTKALSTRLAERGVR